MENEADERLGLYVGRYSVLSRNGEWRMENGEWGMKLRCDWDSVLGVTRLCRETENGEWRMRLRRNSSPFSILLSPFSNLLFENYSLQLIDFAA